MSDIGIMQGRLRPMAGAPRDEFPQVGWREEVALAARLGFTSLEWRLTSDAAENPLWSSEGVAEIHALARQHGLRVPSLYAACFLQRPVLDDPPAARALLRETILRCRHARIGRIVLPVGGAEMLLPREHEQAAVAFLSGVVAFAEAQAITLALALDLSAGRVVSLLERCHSPIVKLCYAPGRAIAGGRDARFEIRRLLPVIAEIHLEGWSGAPHPSAGDERLRHVLHWMACLGYAGPVIVDASAGGIPEEDAARQLGVVRNSLAGAISSS
jgi:sugar phosphate isomerase/epimerase